LKGQNFRAPIRTSLRLPVRLHWPWPRALLVVWQERRNGGRPGPTDQVQIGTGKFFRPMKGLCALFLRTGTKRHLRCVPRPPPSPSSSHRRSFADVVREGKAMASQGSGNGGGFSEHSGGRGVGFNPGFNPGFDPGFEGRGRGRDFHPRGRGRGHGGYGGGCGGHGVFSYNGFGYNSGYQGAGHGGRPYGSGYGSGRGHGGWANHGRPRHQQAMGPAPNTMGGGHLTQQ
jgi:hypothetical protein